MHFAAACFIAMIASLGVLNKKPETGRPDWPVHKWNESDLLNRELLLAKPTQPWRDD